MMASMTAIDIVISPARPHHCEALARLHRDAWRLAYRGIIPHLALERMVARRTAEWWARALRRGAPILVAEFAGELAGYAHVGPSRAPPLGYGGELYELYMKPEYQGLGFGQKLFEAAGARLRRRFDRGFLVWALSDNEPAHDFYRAMGGRKICRATSCFDGVRLAKTGYGWRA